VPKNVEIPAIVVGCRNQMLSLPMVISVVVVEDEDFCFRPRCKSKKAFFSEEKNALLRNE
jgi:hypothetical protein